MLEDEGAHQGKSEPRTFAGMGGIVDCLLEGPADARQQAFRHADTMILHCKCQALARDPRANFDFAARSGKFYSVGQKVEENLAESTLIGREGQLLRR